MPIYKNTKDNPVTNALGGMLPDWLKNNIPEWLKPSNAAPDVNDLAGLNGPLEAPFAAGIGLIKSSPSKALAKRLIESGGNAIKGTSLEEAIHFLANRAPRTFSHISEINPTQLTGAMDGFMGGASLGQFVPHKAPIGGQIGNILVDDIVPHMDVPDAVGVVAHEGTHGVQYLREADKLKGRDWSADLCRLRQCPRKNSIPETQMDRSHQPEIPQARLSRTATPTAPFEIGARECEIQQHAARRRPTRCRKARYPHGADRPQSSRMAWHATSTTLTQAAMEAIRRALDNMARGGGIR
jgi:hypothetical protein